MDDNDRFTRIESIEAIRSLKATYCDLCDDGYDADRLCSLFTEDAIWDGGDLGCFAGHERLHRFFTNMPNVMSFAIHHVTNSAVELSTDGQSAEARWYLLQMATLKEQNRAVWLTGRYIDEVVKTSAGWRFKHVSLNARFFSPHDEGWAQTPFMDISA